MQMKRKKFWIVFGVVCAVIVVLCIVIALVFRLRTVDVEFRSRVVEGETNLSAGVQDQVEGYFEDGKNLLFYNVDSTIAEIERDIPYIKVEQVIRYFPSTLRVYISERLPRYRVQDSDNSNSWYILDVGFKVLDKVTTEEITTKVVSGNSNYYEKTIEISPDSLKIESYVGEFVTDHDSEKNNLSEVVRGIYGDTQDISSVLSISFERNQSGVLTFELTMKNSGNESESGGKIIVSGTNSLANKVFYGIDCYNEYVLKNAEIDQTSAVIEVVEDNGRYEAYLTTAGGDSELVDEEE